VYVDRVFASRLTRIPHLPNFTGAVSRSCIHRTREILVYPPARIRMSAMNRSIVADDAIWGRGDDIMGGKQASYAASARRW
jgi:hypothetical protein